MHVVKIIDQNSFDRVLLVRAFTDPDDAHDWGSKQSKAIKDDLSEAGDDLLDIDYKIDNFYDIDDTTILRRNPQYGWR